MANMLSQLMFKHVVALNQARFLLGICKNVSNPILLLNRFFIKRGYLSMGVAANFRETYGINFYNFDIKTVNSRIEWVQKNEQRSFCRYFNF